MKWNEILKRSLAGLLALVMVFSMLPNIPQAHVHADGEQTAATLDDIAWEDLSYRDIFITNNLAYVDGFNERTFSPFTQNVGENKVTKEACYTKPYSLEVKGTTSNQLKGPILLPEDGNYFVASKVNCTRYEQGALGVCLYSTTVGVQAVTDGFVTAADILTERQNAGIFIGSVHSANLDGYVDDPAVVHMAIFETAPSLEQMISLYDTYVELEKARVREEVPYTEQECLDAFVAYMNEKAEDIGMTSSHFNDPVGMDNLTTARDLVRLMVYADTQYDALDPFWSTESYVVSVGGSEPREKTVSCSYYSNPFLEPYYHILGVKGGSLTNGNIRNLAAILEIPDSDDRLAVVALYALGESDTETGSRAAVKQIADAAMIKYRDPTADNSDAEVSCQSAIAVLIPTEGADLDDLQILYEKDADTQRKPASISKVLTAACVLDVQDDLSNTITYRTFDTDIGEFYVQDFLPGDVVTIEGALYALMLISSNVTARAVARTAGEWILSVDVDEPVWEVGTIAYATGLNRGDTNRLRTADYLRLSDYGYVTVGSGYELVRFVYDENYAMLSGTSWLGNGVGFSVDDLREQYPQGVYFRVALCNVDQRELTVDDLPSTGVTFYAPGEDVQQPGQGDSVWEVGTIASADGLNNASTSRLRTADYLSLSDYAGVGIGLGYTMTNFVYDAEYKYLGTSSWIGNGMSFTTVALREQYPSGVHFRVALRALDQSTLTVADIPATGVKFYAPGETVLQPESSMKYTDVGVVGSWQDGAIHDGKLFVLGGSGTGAVYDLDSLEKLGTVTLDNKDILKPHANSVCFGSTYYAEGDPYPLLYVNIYNNYASAEDRMEGTCCVYRVMESDGQFSTELVQVIRIGFTEDLTLWKSKENNGDVRPYGNFVVDTDNDKLYAYVMRDADKTTRFFGFDLPELTEGAYHDSYGCNVVTLESTDIKTKFDTVYFNYLQGCCYHDGKIISVEGFNSGSSAEPALRIIDLAREKVTGIFYPAEAGLTKEPEVVCVDAADGTLYYAAADGILRTLELELPHTHNYTPAVTAPTCTEQGYTTHTCTVCGDSYVDAYAETAGHSYQNGVCTVCGEAKQGPVILQQPTDGKAKMGERYCVTVIAEGDGLTYQWYGRDVGASAWFKSSVTDNTYDDVMTQQRVNREVYCVITDAYGNAVTTKTVKLRLLPSKIWEQWTQEVTLTSDTYPTYGGSSTGYYNKGQTFGGILYSSTFREGTDVLWNLNPSTYYSAVANPASLLYTEDYRGRVGNESAWAGSVCSTTALKACGYDFPYSSNEIREGFREKTNHDIDQLEFGDILWVKGHVAGVIGVTVEEDQHVSSVKIIEQNGVVKVFEVTAAQWEEYFSNHWTTIYRGDFDETLVAPVEYSDNFSIIFERGNNTYVTDHSQMLFYIPTATTVFLTKNGETTQHATGSFPSQMVNGTTVYDLASLFTGVGDYHFHTDEDPTDMCIKVINQGSITISGTTATLSGYNNCTPYGYRVIRILDDSKSSAYNFFDAPEGYTSDFVNLSFRKIGGDAFEIENIPECTAGWKLEVFYDTGYGWARSLGGDIMRTGETVHSYEAVVTDPTCTGQGYTTHTCKFCGDSYVDSWVEAVGHSYGEWVQVTAPSCDAEGQDKRSCVSCGEVQYRDTRVSGDPNKILVSDPLPEDYFEGKKIVLIGDSITYGVGVSDRATETYGALLSEILGATVVNKGVSGSGYCTGGKMATNKTLTEDNIRDADVITIMLGVNDWAWAVKDGFWNGKPGYYDTSYTYYQLGEFGSDDTSTFYGALKSWCEKIVAMKQLEGFGEKHFVVITPLITSWNNSMGERNWDQTKTNVHGHTMRQYCTAIMEVCAYYGIPVFDANMFSGIYYNGPEDTNVQEVGGDGVHVNAKGHALLAQSLAQFLLEGYSYEDRAVDDCGHSYTSVITEPTCTVQGYTTHSCPDCHYSYTDAYVDALGHTPGEAVKENEGEHGCHDLVVYCTRCGEELSREAVEGYVPGDINGDGSVDNKDLTRLFRYLSGYEVEVVEAALDVNGDGSINNKDQARLFRYLSGWNVEIY